jgi:hypothetical protein
MTAPEKYVMSFSVLFVHSRCIQLQFLESLFLTDVCNLLPVLTYEYFVVRRANPDDETMEDVKKSLSDNDIDFNQPKDRNVNCCRVLLVG